MEAKAFLKNLFVISLVIFCVGFLAFSCGDPEIEDDFFCPPCDGVVTWNSYDGCLTHHFGGDSWGWRLKSDCGWEIYNGQEGGYGHTLQLISCNGGVIFIWAWQEFNWFYVREGWTGETAEGIKIGDSLEKFLFVYPEFVKNEYMNYCELDTDEFLVNACFDANDRLSEIQVYPLY